MSRELLQKALEAIRKNLVSYSIKDEPALYDVFIKIEAELAKPDEPVAWRREFSFDGLSYHEYYDEYSVKKGIDVSKYEPLYTSPQPKPLTPSDFLNAAPWQPMETAPKDTAGILLKNSDGEIQICQFGIGSWKFGAYYEETFHEPMAWIPLPEQK